jgi:ribose transport system substrate-binding protein
MIKPGLKTKVVAALAACAWAYAAPARAQNEPTIPIIVKDTTSFYWQIVLAGARKAGHSGRPSMRLPNR